jgi:hypothetical protein
MNRIHNDQEELDVSDTHRRRLEDALDEKTAALINLQKAVATSDSSGRLLSQASQASRSIEYVYSFVF